jgi:hypothetical protein
VSADSFSRSGQNASRPVPESDQISTGGDQIHATFVDVLHMQPTSSKRELLPMGDFVAAANLQFGIIVSGHLAFLGELIELSV